MEKLATHSDSIRVFNDMVYKKVYHAFQVRSDEKIIKETIEELNKEVFYKGYELKDNKNKMLYFVKTEDITKMPFTITETKELWYRSKVYHLITALNSVKMVESEDMSSKEFVNITFPAEHTNPDDLLIAKLMLVTGSVSKSFFRISTQNGFGKDAIANTIIGLTGMGASISKASPARLAMLIDEGFTFFNEVSGYKGEDKEIIQDFLLNTGDTKNNTYQHKTTGSEKTSIKYDTSHYGYCIMHNLPKHYLNKGIDCFEQMFTDPVFYRFPPFLLQGQVDDFKFVNAKFNPNEVVKGSMLDYKAYVGRFLWLRNHWSEVVCPYDITKYDWKYKTDAGGRWLSNMLSLAKMVYLYSDSEEEFYRLFDIINKRNRDYLAEIDKFGLMSI